MEDYEVVINLFKDVLGEDYIVRKLYVEDYGKGIISYGERNWTNGLGSAYILAKKNDLKNLKDNDITDVYNILKLITKIYNKGHSVIIGSDLYYGSVLELDIPKRLSINLFLNKICCYTKDDSFRNIFKVINSYLINYGYNEVDKLYINKIKKE